MEESVNLLGQIKKLFACADQDIRTYSPLALAYMGDAVYDLVIRTVVVERANRSANQLHRDAVKYVKAKAQAEIIQALLPELTEEEAAVYRRGRNAKPHTTAKNATLAEYKMATGFEALMGYLYLTDRQERMLTLIHKGIALAGLDTL